MMQHRVVLHNDSDAKLLNPGEFDEIDKLGRNDRQTITTAAGSRDSLKKLAGDNN